MNAEKFFDGYNTIRVYDREECFVLIKYYADEWYSGDRSKLFTVRTGGDDIADFRTLKEARTFFRHCVRTYKRMTDENRHQDTIDEILRTWKF